MQCCVVSEPVRIGASEGVAENEAVLEMVWACFEVGRIAVSGSIRR